MGGSQNHLIIKTPAKRRMVPKTRQMFKGWTGYPRSPKWSKTKEAIIWPARKKANMVVAPNLGTAAMVTVTRKAPHNPPSQSQKGILAIPPREGQGVLRMRM